MRVAATRVDLSLRQRPVTEIQRLMPAYRGKDFESMLGGQRVPGLSEAVSLAFALCLRTERKNECGRGAYAPRPRVHLFVC